MGRPFNPRIRDKLDQPSLQDLAADRLRSSNPHRSHERRQRLFLNAVSSLGGFRTPASPCLARPAPEARVRNPSPQRPYDLCSKRMVLSTSDAAGTLRGPLLLPARAAHVSPRRDSASGGLAVS